MNIGHLGGLRAKTSMSSGKWAERDVSVPLPISFTFSCWKCTDICGKVANRCLTYFMVETSG